MDKKWIKYTQLNPYKSILIAVFVGSAIGISIKYLINQDIRFEGLLGLIVVTAFQLYLVSKRDKKK
ncbi:hypothetical protein [Bavariicoccus seileri]|uniref:hypothetical protein n=1 Tax=Bavariicoccus seileri TaxID=549685 RepID=UPI0003B4B6C4|nr:hypothetical protein [Bavariicoccus seileri]